MENEALSRAQEAKLAKLAEEFFAGDERPLPGISARGAGEPPRGLAGCYQIERRLEI